MSIVRTEELPVQGAVIGLSFGLCIKAIANDEVEQARVVKIIAGTVCETCEDWEEVISVYKASWRNPDYAEAIAWQFIQQGLVEQPRLSGDKAPHISRGTWLVE